jgi:hypothetical protein
MIPRRNSCFTRQAGSAGRSVGARTGLPSAPQSVSSRRYPFENLASAPVGAFSLPPRWLRNDRPCACWPVRHGSAYSLPANATVPICSRRTNRSEVNAMNAFVVGWLKSSVACIRHSQRRRMRRSYPILDDTPLTGRALDRYGFVASLTLISQHLGQCANARNRLCETRWRIAVRACRRASSWWLSIRHSGLMLPGQAIGIAPSWAQAGRS